MTPAFSEASGFARPAAGVGDARTPPMERCPHRAGLAVPSPDLTETGRVALAVDGGNSKTDVAVVTEDGRVLATGRGGPCTPQTSGAAATADVVVAAVEALGGRRRFDLVAAYLAGADLPAEEEELARELGRRGLGGEIVVRNDVFALLRAGASGPWGVAVVCGAGINAAGVSPSGEVARFPALGRLSGDWGGGEGLGEEALWHAVRAEDGRGPATSLADLVRAHFGTATVEELVLAVHTGAVPAGRLGELAPAVFAAAAAGDAVAGALADRQADEVAVLAEVCLRRLGLLETRCEVVLGGGVLTAGHPRLMRRLESALTAAAPRAVPVLATLPAIAGAALGALDRLGAPETAKTRLRAHFAHL